METNFEFRKQVLDYHIGPDVIKYCYQCSRCADNCPVTAVTTDFYSTQGYNPRGNILMALLGYKDLLLGGDDLTIWGCTVCDTCDEVCPQKVELTEIFTLIKNRCFERGNVPDGFIAQSQAVLHNGIAIPYSKAILTRREKLGLPVIKTAPINEIKTILKETKFEVYIPKEGE